jgi:hypothetical protein
MMQGTLNVVDRRKLALDEEQVNRSFALKERRLDLERELRTAEIDIRRRELEIKTRDEGWFSRLFSPLTTTLFAGMLTIAGSVAGTVFQGGQTVTLEREKYEFSKRLDLQKQQHELILKMISVGEITQAKENLKFLAETGLITDTGLADRILNAKTSPVLPAPAGTAAAPSGLEAQTCDVPVTQRADGLAGEVAVAEEWVRRNIVALQVPQLTKLFPAIAEVPFNAEAAAALKQAFAEIEQAGLLDRVKTWDGGFVAKTAPGSARLSIHACGIAFDINARWNGPLTPPPPPGAEGSVRELVPIFEKHGFQWGGRAPRPEGMHFEFVLPKAHAAAHP